MCCVILPIRSSYHGRPRGGGARAGVGAGGGRGEDTGSEARSWKQERGEGGNMRCRRAVLPRASSRGPSACPPRAAIRDAYRTTSRTGPPLERWHTRGCVVPPAVVLEITQRAGRPCSRFFARRFPRHGLGAGGHCPPRVCRLEVTSV